MARRQWVWQLPHGTGPAVGLGLVSKALDRLQRYLRAPVPITTLRYEATVTVDLEGEQEMVAELEPTDGVAFAVAAPVNGEDGAVLDFTVINSTGGALGALTFDAVYQLDAAWTQPATGTRRNIVFRKSGANWWQRSVTGDL